MNAIKRAMPKARCKSSTGGLYYLYRKPVVFLIRLVNAFPSVNAIEVYRLLFSNANLISRASLRERRTQMINDLSDPARILLMYLHQGTRKHRQQFQIAQYATIVISTIDPKLPRRVAPPLIASTCSRSR